MKNNNRSAAPELKQLIEQLKKYNKTLDNEEFIKVTKELKSICINNQLIDSMLHSIEILNHTKPQNNTKLTKREVQVLSLIGNGLKSSAIAHKLNLSTATIETHRKNIRKKLQLNGHINLMVYGLLHNLQNPAFTKEKFFFTK